jgi:hypothetical protein
VGGNAGADVEPTPVQVSPEGQLLELAAAAADEAELAGIAAVAVTQTPRSTLKICPTGHELELGDAGVVVVVVFQLGAVVAGEVAAGSEVASGTPNSELRTWAVEIQVLSSTTKLSPLGHVGVDMEELVEPVMTTPPLPVGPELVEEAKVPTAGLVTPGILIQIPRTGSRVAPISHEVVVVVAGTLTQTLAIGSRVSPIPHETGG